MRETVRVLARAQSPQQIAPERASFGVFVFSSEFRLQAELWSITSHCVLASYRTASSSERDQDSTSGFPGTQPLQLLTGLSVPLATARGSVTVHVALQLLCSQQRKMKKDLMDQLPQTQRTTLKRLPKRGSHEREVINRILDEGFICHVGFAIDGQPFVIPTGYARAGDKLLIHGSQASRMLRALKGGIDACVTVTLIDGLVLARSAFITR